MNYTIKDQNFTLLFTFLFILIAFSPMIFIFASSKTTTKYDRWEQEYDSCIQKVKKQKDYSFKDTENCEVLSCIHHNIKGNCFSD